MGGIENKQDKGRGKMMISRQDMTDLVYVYDAYITINKALFGDTVLLGFYEGNFGAISRIFNVIERNVADGLKKDDYKTTWEILDILKELHKAGRTVIVITHDPEIARQAERVIQIKDGRIVGDDQNESEKKTGEVLKDQGEYSGNHVQEDMEYV